MFIKKEIEHKIKSIFGEVTLEESEDFILVLYPENIMTVSCVQELYDCGLSIQSMGSDHILIRKFNK